ncbi:flavodoxin domain-containing protein [Variovorax paradoxus B4]|uniref:Flavodoxin domain-containing protein n=1 Tax=Variovorax paradoxus B4 TaxID=1246301 RepID=T1XKR1_VARPD|nr:flavodoxin domain-containing protein [Variovorax paradoxus]AGU52899.1 flavodoxin domain-containing protein [Variovorax paradoxus B4]
MNKILVVVYSYTGTSRKVAQLLCSQQGWPMAEIAETRPRAGAFGSFRCLLDSVFRRRPAIRYDGPKTKDFDAVVLVSPIWGQRLAGPMRSFVGTRRNHLPDVAVISVMGGRGAPNAVAEISRLIGRAPMLDTTFTTHEVDNGSFATRLQAFGTAVRSAEGAQSAVRPAVLSPQAV